jgi:hypothetical protein
VGWLALNMHLSREENPMDFIFYKKGYKYQAVKEYVVKIPIQPEQVIDTDYIALTAEGDLTVKKGYAWDGPSGPTFDTLNFMRASLVHDALYQLMREGYLDHDRYRQKADRLLENMCKQDGMWKIRAWWVYLGVRFGGGPAADPAHKKPVIKAPKKHKSA